MHMTTVVVCIIKSERETNMYRKRQILFNFVISVIVCLSMMGMCLFAKTPNDAQNVKINENKMLRVGKETHTPTKPYNWYFIPNRTSTQPLLDVGLKFIENHDAFYVDKNASENDKVIYLTFDAGYANENVYKIVDVLDSHNAKGAFFVLDNIIIRNTDLIEKMINSGHLVCNHTCKHRDMTKFDDQIGFEEEIKSLENVYTEYTGNDIAKFYRPPEGKFNEQNLIWAENLGYKTIFWSFAYADWDNDNQPDSEKSIKKVLDHTHNGMIILLHPTSKTNADILDTLLTEWEKQGYRFASLEELR